MPLTAESAARKDKTNARGATFEHRHFAAIAGVLARAMPTKHDATFEIRKEEWRGYCHTFADELAETNPRFDRARFLAACGV